MDKNEILELIKDFDEKTQRIICVKFAIACAEKCLHKWTDKYTDDKRPQEAIEAAKKWLDDPSDINKNAADAAGGGACAAGATNAASHAMHAIHVAVNTIYNTIYASSTATPAVYDSAYAASCDVIYTASHAAFAAYYASGIIAIDYTNVVDAASHTIKADSSISKEWQLQTLKEIVNEYSST